MLFIVHPNFLTRKTSEMAVKSFRGALNGGGKRREAGKTGSSKLHKVFTPFGILWNYDKERYEPNLPL